MFGSFFHSAADSSDPKLMRLYYFKFYKSQVELVDKVETNRESEAFRLFISEVRGFLLLLSDLANLDGVAFLIIFFTIHFVIRFM